MDNNESKFSRFKAGDVITLLAHEWQNVTGKLSSFASQFQQNAKSFGGQFQQSANKFNEEKIQPKLSKFADAFSKYNLRSWQKPASSYEGGISTEG